jgi:predicted dehydrogenase/threonine dehydrogenase-like Zn-dependent dehydrogenase
MQQLTQQLKSGKMEILEVPFPALGKGQVLVRNHFSVISAGTEGKTVTDARKGYIAKVRSRQKEVKQVLEMIRTNGIKQTYDLVMNKLEAPSPLGYSCAGEVIAVGESVVKFTVGDHVACGGASAFHADVIAVPVNLCVKVHRDTDLRQAAFTTIASIAVQGIRQADLEFGHNCVVIGLGLIGQITLQLLKASGIKAIGIDLSEQQVELAKKGNCPHAFNRNQEGLEEIILNLTNGYGADGVIITAGTSSLDPVEFAGKIARKKAKVVIVGAVPTGFSREHYYKKELDLRMSSSYGPGRYDSNYEEKGIDYPVGYVRFTENRNMQSFIDLLERGSLDIGYLVTHEFELPDAPEAYRMILGHTQPYAGILISYDKEKSLKMDILLKEARFVPSEPNVGFIGAGNFAQNMLLPRMKNLCRFAAIATSRGNDTLYVAKKYGFANAFDDGDKVISDPAVNTIFILTRHDTHASFVLKSIEAGKHVFTEKPLALHPEELEEIKEKFEASGREHHLMVGFNRRFSPHIKKLKNLFLDEQAKAINIRINAGNLPSDHWVNDPGTGGGRLIGEACHFIDLAMFIAGSRIISVFANALNDPHSLNNTVSINLKFENGSIANLSYFSNGAKRLPKELIEVFCGETTVIIDDFRKLTIYGKSKKINKLRSQDKGHSQEMKEYLDSIRNGLPCPIPFKESYLSTLATFKVLDSLKGNHVISL